jgi:hypothetical protein
MCKQQCSLPVCVQRLVDVAAKTVPILARAQQCALLCSTRSTTRCRRGNGVGERAAFYTRPWIYHEIIFIQHAIARVHTAIPIASDVRFFMRVPLSVERDSHTQSAAVVIDTVST